MKITGRRGCMSLDLIGATPRTTYIVQFQDLGSGRRTVLDVTTDVTGNATFPAPMNWDSGRYKGSLQAIGEASLIHLTNDWDGEDFVMSSAPKQSMFEKPTPPDQPVS